MADDNPARKPAPLLPLNVLGTFAVSLSPIAIRALLPTRVDARHPRVLEPGRRRQRRAGTHRNRAHLRRRHAESSSRRAPEHPGRQLDLHRDDDRYRQHVTDRPTPAAGRWLRVPEASRVHRWASRRGHSPSRRHRRRRETRNRHVSHRGGPQHCIDRAEHVAHSALES